MSYFTLIVRLSDGETWTQLTDHNRHPLEFPSLTHAHNYLRTVYPGVLQGVHYRCDVFHGLQPIKIAEVKTKETDTRS